MRITFFFFIYLCLQFDVLSQSQDKSQNAIDYTIKSENYLFRGELDSAEIFSRKALALVNESKDPSEIAFVKNNRGLLMNRLTHFDSAMAIHLEILEYCQSNGLIECIAETNYHIGLTKYFISDFEDSKMHFRNAYDYYTFQKIFDSEYYGKTLNGLAILALIDGQLDSALSLVKQSIIVFGEDYQNSQAANYSLLAHILTSKKDYKNAIMNYNKALDIYLSQDRRLNLPQLYLGLADVYALQGNKKEVSKNVLAASESVITDYTNPDQLYVYEYLSNYYESEGDFKNAFYYYKLKKSKDDELLITDKLLSIAKIESQVQKAVESFRVELLQQELNVQKRGNERKKTWIFVSILISVYLFGFVVVSKRLINQKNKAQNILETKNKELESKNKQIAEAQKRLIQSEKMALLGRLSAGIAHELNTPISALKGNIELIDNLQKREIEKLTSFAGEIGTRELLNFIQLIFESEGHKNKVLTTVEERKLNRKVLNYFEHIDIPNKEEVAELFADLKVDTDLHRFADIYSHSSNVEILEMIIYKINSSQAIDIAQIALEKALKILGSFKTYSFKRGWEELKTFYLHENLEMILSLHQNILKKIQVVKNYEGDLKFIGMPDELSQVWSNIITNSVYAMNYIGKLTINLSGHSDHIFVEIEDTGGGINVPENTDVFEPFFTTKPEGEGNGIGLDISRQIIMKHNGKIDYVNTDKGATFRITLPKKFDSIE